MKIALMGKNVITDSERREIDTKIGQEKMLYVIVDIVIPSLKSNFYKKYRGFLEAMEESYDIDLKSTAKILGELIISLQSFYANPNFNYVAT